MLFLGGGGGWGGGRGGASIRQGAFIREGRRIQTIHLKGAAHHHHHHLYLNTVKIHQACNNLK